MKVLLAGGAGFLLSNFSTWLLQHTDADVVTVDNLSDTPDLSNIEAAMRTKRRHQFYLADVADVHIIGKILELESPDVIVYAIPHSAAQSNLYNLCDIIMNKGHSVKKIIVIDSEKDKFKTQVDSYRNYFKSPIDLVSTDQVYGSRQSTRGFVAKIAASLLKGETLDLENISVDKAEWLYVRDLYNGVYSIVEEPAGKDYTITSGFVQTYKEVAEMLLNIYKGNRHFNVDSRISRGQETLHDSSVMRNLGWQPQFGLLTSLEHTLSWYSDNRWALKW